MRSFKTIFRINQYLLIGNFVLVALVLGAGVMFFLSNRLSNDQIEARQIVLRSENGKEVMVLSSHQNKALLALNDETGQVRLQLQGGEFPAMMIKNQTGEVVGTFFPMQEGGAALGLGNQAGEMATFVRGGNSPGIGFYSQSQMPQTAMGISQGVPHFLLFPIIGPEGMVIDGSNGANLLFFDNEGEAPVRLSRYGLYHQSSQDDASQDSSNKKTTESVWNQFCEPFTLKHLRAGLKLPDYVKN